jgi:hypothetical protein
MSTASEVDEKPRDKVIDFYASFSDNVAHDTFQLSCLCVRSIIKAKLLF